MSDPASFTVGLGKLKVLAVCLGNQTALMSFKTNSSEMWQSLFAVTTVTADAHNVTFCANATDFKSQPMTFVFFPTVCQCSSKHLINHLNVGMLGLLIERLTEDEWLPCAVLVFHRHDGCCCNTFSCLDAGRTCPVQVNLRGLEWSEGHKITSKVCPK